MHWTSANLKNITEDPNKDQGEDALNEGRLEEHHRRPRGLEHHEDEKTWVKIHWTRVTLKNIHDEDQGGYAQEHPEEDHGYQGGDALDGGHVEEQQRGPRRRPG